MAYTKEHWDKFHSESGGKNKNLRKRKIFAGTLAAVIALAFISRSCGNDESTPVTTTTSTTLETTTTSSTSTTSTTVAPTTAPETTIPVEIFGFEVGGEQIECEVQSDPYIVQRGDSISKIVRIQNGDKNAPEQIAGTIAYNQAIGLVDDPNLIFAGMQLRLLQNCQYSPAMPVTL